MNSLVELELNANRLTSFFDHLGPNVTLRNLSYLNLNQNQFSNIPSVIVYLPKLSTLHMAMNRLTEVQMICSPTFKENLQVLDVSSNKITELPRALPFYLANLNHLNIENNEIRQLPNLLGLHQNLKNLQVNGNPLKTIRLNIIDRGCEAVMKHLRDRFNEAYDSELEEWAKNLAPQDTSYAPQTYQEEAKQPSQGYPSGYGYSQQPQQVSYGQPPSSYQQPGYSQAPSSYGHPAAQAPPQADNSAKISEIEMKIQTLTAQVSQVYQDIENDFSLSKAGIHRKRMEANHLMAEKNQLQDDLAQLMRQNY